MISISQTVQYINNVACVISTYYGLSTDIPKPTEGVGNGSAFIEMDTSKVYFFDAGNSEWLEWGAESASASTLSASPSLSRPSLTLGNTLSPDVASPDVVEDMPVMAEDVPDVEEPDVEEQEMSEGGEDE